jgi:serine protease Do
VGLAALALAVGGMGWAGAGEDRREVHKVKVKVLHAEDGNEETIEWAGNGPLPFLGVSTEKDDAGLRIEKVIEGTGAERGGLKDGDVIVSFDGQPIDDSFDLVRGVFSKSPGDRVEIEVLRDGRRETFPVEIGEHPALGDLDDLDLDLGDIGDIDVDIDLSHLEQQLEKLGERLGRMQFGLDASGSPRTWHRERPRLGVLLIEPTSELRTHLGAPEDAGVIVSRVLPGTPAEEAGLRVGDVITHAAGEPIDDGDELRVRLREAEGGTIRLELVRDGKGITLDVELPVGPEA